MKFDNERLNFIPTEFKNIDAYTYAPVIAGIWQQHELWDGTYNLDDLLDAHEMLAVKRDNESKAYKAAEKER
ncbi:DUF6889 family protein [Clostridium estertheticum]|uniref:DUF6889 family protein n=1 Tax=Clostridium estertheticum TaxID=238834 RepID=UPI0035C804CD